MSIQQPLKWHGGKFYLADKILSCIPEHTHYVEPYFGGGAVFFRKPISMIENHSEVINDAYYLLMNFYTSLQSQLCFEELQKQLELTPFSEQVWLSAKNHPDGFDVVKGARDFFIRYRQSRQGLGSDFATLSKTRTRRGMNEQVSSWLSAIDGLPEAHARLQRVVIMCKDALRVIASEDSSSTFYYCFHPSTKVQAENGELVDIANVRPGLKIAPGRTVLTTHTKQWSGECLRIHVQGVPDPIIVTPEHPVPRIARHFKRQEKRTDADLRNAYAVVNAETVALNDYLLLPQSILVEKMPSWSPNLVAKKHGKRVPCRINVTPDLFRFLGYYAAEGHIQRTKKGDPCSVILSFNANERFTWLDDACNCAFNAFGLRPQIKPGPNNASNVLQVILHNSAIAEFVASVVPGTAKDYTKALTAAIMVSPCVFQEELLKGWLRGDGGLHDSGRNRWKLCGSSAARELAEQMYRIALRCGLRPSFKVRAKRIFDVYFAAADAERLGWSVPRKRKTCTTRRLLDGNLLCRVRKIERIPYQGPVYDLTVDKNHLFCAPYVLMHNCDPPYLQTTRQTQGTYAHEMTSDDHLKLLQALGTIKGKFLLSGYPSSLYDTYAEKFGWCKREIKIDNKASAKKVKEIKTECLWANYDLPLEIAPLPRLIQQEFQGIQGVDC